jgi:hypothetical protein
MREVGGLGLVLLALLGSCTGSREGGSGSGSAGSRCAAGQPAPVTTAMLIEALREHGFDAGAEGAVCVDGLAVAAVTNDGPKDSDDVREREGVVDCELERRTRVGAAVDSYAVSGEDYSAVRVLNVFCTIHASEPAQVTRLEAALRSLPGVR